jgi:hypothetical protein
VVTRKGDAAIPATNRDLLSCVYSSQLEAFMSSTDDVLRCQARALIRVLSHYKLYRIGDGAPTLLWRAVEAYGTASSGARDLCTIHRDFNGTALAASAIGLRHEAANAAMFLALHTFCGTTDDYRFLKPAWWISVTITWLDKRPVPEPGLQGEVLERLEAAFDREIESESAAFR